MTQEQTNTVTAGVMLLVGAAALAFYTYGAILSRRGTKKYIESLG